MAASTGNHILRIRSLLVLLATGSHLFLPVAAECYWPDGSNAYNMQECYGPKGADGLCCAPGDLCLMNRLCRNEVDRSLYRGACNMPNWTQAMTCPRFCVNKEHKNNMTDIHIVDECYDAPGFFVCHAGIAGRNSCFDWNNPLFMLSGRSASFLVLEIGVPLRIPGCDEEYNAAGSPTLAADMPTCSNYDDPSPTSLEGDIGPSSTFATHFVPTLLSEPLIRRALQIPRGSSS